MRTDFRHLLIQEDNHVLKITGVKAFLEKRSPRYHGR